MTRGIFNEYLRPGGNPPTPPPSEEVYITPEPLIRSNGDQTRSAPTTYEGGVYELAKDMTFNRVCIRNTGAAGNPAGVLAIYQNQQSGQEGTYNGDTALSLVATCEWSPGGVASNYIITPNEITGPVTELNLYNGLFWAIYGIDGAIVGSSLTMRTQAVNSQDLRNANIPSVGGNAYPVTFTTGLVVTAGSAPATLDPRQSGDGGDTVASTNDTPPIISLATV